jgi:hypothetical protein
MKERGKMEATPFINNTPEEHPWHVALVDKEKRFFCAGTLVSNAVVITGEKK